MKKVLLLIIFAIVLITLLVSRNIFGQTPQTTQTPNPTASPVPPTITTPEKKEIEEVQAWIYPGEPSCTAFDELKKGARVDVAKIEFFTIGNQGDLELIRAEDTECNGYSEENIQQLSQYSSEIFVTVSGHQVQMSKMLASSVKKQQAITLLLDIAKNIAIRGIELDFEDFSAWSQADYQGYIEFVTALGTQLQSAGKELMLDGPAIANQEQQSWYKWKYEDFNSLPVSHIVVMAYDYQNDQGAGEAITPTFWLKDVVNWTKSRVQDQNKIIIGLPVYGYKGKVGSFQTSILTKKQLDTTYRNQLSWSRDDESQELYATLNGEFFALSDQQSITYKAEQVSQMGVSRISLWHLGGNDWVNY